MRHCQHTLPSKVRLNILLRVSKQSSQESRAARNRGHLEETSNGWELEGEMGISLVLFSPLACLKFNPKFPACQS